MNALRPSASELWIMEPHTFNEWRSTNDLPLLFDYLKTILPGFQQWLAGLPFGMDVVLRIVPTGDLFKGERPKAVIGRLDDSSHFHPRIVECREGSAEDAVAFWASRRREVEVLGEFIPYFSWAKSTLGRKRLITYDAVNRQIADDFMYGSWRSGPGTYQAFLFKDFEVLKLDHVTLPDRLTLGGRNLDFCNLDGVTITGRLHGSTWAYVNYSSCQDFKISDCDLAFLTFHKCAMNSVRIVNSKLQDIYLERSDLLEVVVEESFIFRMGFRGSRVRPFFRDTEARELTFAPSKVEQPANLATTYRLFRSIFQASGLRREAADYYYKERVFERKALYHPYLLEPTTFSGVLHGGRLSVVLDRYHSGHLDRADVAREVGRVVMGWVKMLVLPRYAIPLWRSRGRWLLSGLECLLWGYGERPIRILLTSILAITLFAGVFHYGGDFAKGEHPSSLGWLDSFYFSTVTFTTLGYGDILPKSDYMKIVTGAEALFGAFAIGLFVAGFSNRSRY